MLQNFRTLFNFLPNPVFAASLFRFFPFLGAVYCALPARRRCTRSRVPSSLVAFSADLGSSFPHSFLKKSTKLFRFLAFICTFEREKYLSVVWVPGIPNTGNLEMADDALICCPLVRTRISRSCRYLQIYFPRCSG